MLAGRRLVLGSAPDGIPQLATCSKGRRSRPELRICGSRSVPIASADPFLVV
jgi:hypothetical protein